MPDPNGPTEPADSRVERDATQGVGGDPKNLSALGTERVSAKTPLRVMKVHDALRGGCANAGGSGFGWSAAEA